MLKNFYDYYLYQLEAILDKKMPHFLAKELTTGTEGLLKRVLDLNILITRKYTNKRYFEETNGIG
jgi:hypothetical protein